MSRRLSLFVCLLACAAIARAATVIDDDFEHCPYKCEEAGKFEDQWMDVEVYSDLPAHHKGPFALLGWTEEAWDGCWKCWKNNWVYYADYYENDVPLSLSECVQQEYLSGDNPLCPISEVMKYSQLSADQKAAALELGYTPSLWDATSPFSCCYEESLDEELAHGLGKEMMP